MIKSVFSKTLFEKRWSLVGWSIAVAAMTALTAAFFPTFKKTFGASLQDVPESMKAFLGDASTYQTLGGFVDVQVIAQLVFLTIIMGVIYGSGLIAGDEGAGTLQSLLAQPIKRQKVYIQKLLAMILLLLVSTSMIFIAVYLTSLAISESIDLWRLAQATFGVWLITLVFAVLAYALGAITGKRGLSGSTAGMLAFVSYLITSLAMSITALKTVDKFSPFHYFNTPSILANGIDWGNVSVLIGVISVLSVAGFWRFLKRDIG